MIFAHWDDANRERWRRYDILDVTRGLWLNDLPITYLDSAVGYYRVLLENDDGQYYADPNDPDEVAAESRLCKMSVSLKAKEPKCD